MLSEREAKILWGLDFKVESLIQLGFLSLQKFWNNSKTKTSDTFFFFNWDSPHARLNSHYEAWSYKKKKRKKIIGYRKSV